MSKKTIFWTLLGGFVAANVMVYKHAYHFTHVTEGKRSLSPESLSFSQKLKILLGGISLPKSQNITSSVTTSERKTLYIPTRNNKYKLECWYDEVENAKGIVLLFHGYGGCKSSYELEADYFREIGYSTLLVDFIGHGGSEGKAISLGYHEADDVKAVFDFFKNKENNIILYGASMGAASILRAVAVYNLKANKLILECPFATMKQTVKGRFEVMGVPSVGFAEWLMFWGGLQHGFWAFGHNPKEYAKKVQIPTLLMGGKYDARVKNWEINTIYQNLGGKKERIWIEAGHESYIMAEPNRWKTGILNFL
ncbi:alpha/beta hydrolase [Bernardetia sp.]|uniref:alpha/beta hydrolase n=1 Tax=Bernardetia sp. TaxID=1937974 RepID=UPI0025C074CC|nr:alpha/beta fold hydrolase [Bernardetia sp.]